MRPSRRHSTPPPKEVLSKPQLCFIFQLLSDPPKQYFLQKLVTSLTCLSGKDPSHPAHAIILVLFIFFSVPRHNFKSLLSLKARSEYGYKVWQTAVTGCIIFLPIYVGPLGTCKQTHLVVCLHIFPALVLLRSQICQKTKPEVVLAASLHQNLKHPASFPIEQTVPIPRMVL